MRLSLYSHLRDTIPDPREVEFADLPSLLGVVESADRATVPLWAPHEVVPGGTRLNAHIARVHAGVLDLDGISPLDLVRVVLGSLAGTSHWVHTTYRDAVQQRSTGARRARVVVELSRPVDRTEWPEFWRRLRARCGSIAKQDRSCKDPARFYFVPSCPPGAAVTSELLPGEPLDVDALLAADFRALSGPRPTLEGLARLAEKLRPRRAELAGRVEALAAGRTFADAGERDTACFLLACELTRRYPAASEEEIARTFWHSIAAMSGAPGALTDAQVRDKVARARAQVEDRAEEDLSELRARWRECLRRAFREAPYDEGEISAAADALGVPADRLGACWVLQHERSYYLLSCGDGEARYDGPYLHSALPERAEVALAPADPHGVACQIRLRGGKIGRKAPSDLVADHGTVLDRVRRAYQTSGPVLDLRSRVLTLPAAPPRDLEPERDEQVDAWLRLLGGEKLLDWVATLTRQDAPSAALFVHGPRGVGKDLLAAGLARIWTDGGACPMESAFHKFNDRLYRCPLVWANEAVPCDYRGRPLIQRIKGLITDGVRDVETKGAPIVPLEGCARVLITANNLDWLAGAGDLDRADVEALVYRILHVRVPVDDPAPGRFLETLGGRPALERWVAGDALARHALWLARERRVEPGTRLLVDGDGAGLLRAITTRSGTRALVCQWLVTWLMQPERARAGAVALVRVRHGRVLASAKGIHDAWDLYLRSDRVPQVSRVAAALRGLEIGREDVPAGSVTVRHSVVSTEALQDWADAHGYCSRQDVLALIAALERSQLASLGVA